MQEIYSKLVVRFKLKKVYLVSIKEVQNSLLSIKDLEIYVDCIPPIS